MAQHVKILGILHIVFGALGALFALLIMTVFGGIAGIVHMNAETADAAVAAPVLVVVGGIVMIFILLLAVPGIIAGFGLLQFRPWARILTIVLSALDLLHVPFGTALGIYGLWVLLSADGEAVFRQPPGVPFPAKV
ncbi:MAG: hypothetical protein ACRD9L_28645 [Bryobacteraceae bacterium]